MPTTSKTIRADSFKGTPFDILETLLINKRQMCNNLFPEIIANDKIDSDSSFFALAAPSLEGKTQSAFVLEKVKPLYFSLSETLICDRGKVQDIYKNFASLSSCIQSAALDDIAEIKKLADNSEYRKNNRDSIQDNLAEIFLHQV